MCSEQMPPRLFLRFFRWFCRPSMLKYIEGDLIELYAERRMANKHKANLRFIVDVILLLRPGIIRPLVPSNPLTETIMLENYLKVGWRNILKYKAFSFINVFGLSLAMAVSMLVILMVVDASRYDQFHEKKERVYRILSDTESGKNPYATSPYSLATTLRSEYSIVEDATNLTPGIGGDAAYKNRLAEIRGYFTDPSFFNILSFKLDAGDATTALHKPYSMVISKSVAKALFNEENPIGKTVEFADRQLSFPIRSDGAGVSAVDWGSFTITGVIDESKYASHLEFDVLVSSSTRQSLIQQKKMEDLSNNWEWYFRTYTFVLLKDGKTVGELNNALADLVAHKYKDIKAEHIKGFNLSSQNITDIQFGVYGNDTNTRLPLIGYYFVGILALIIIVSACFNYTNLSIARALTRAKEIGVRKVTGAQRRSLIFQFLTESMLTAVFALCMGLVFLNLLIPLFEGLWINQYLRFDLAMSYNVYGIFLGFALLIGLVSGLFPAFHLARFQPVKVLKQLGAIRPGKFRLRKVLIVTQFSISLLFITTAILIYGQFKHYLEFDYGFNSKNIVNVDLQGADYEKLKNEFSGVSGVSTVSASDILPALSINNGSALRRAATKDEYTQAGIIHADDQFFNMLDVNLVAGKNFTTDPTSVIVNEELVRQLGYHHPAEIIGEGIESKWSDEILIVSGVVSDFRHISLINSNDVGALMLRNKPTEFKFIQVRIEGDRSPVLTQLEEKWKRIDPVHPIKYEFYDDQLASMHQGIFDLVSIVGFITFMAIVISCLGLLGMATYSVERKRKEVGIRKVLGAADFSLTLLLSREFLILLGVSIAIASPLSYFFNTAWLQMLPNRVNFNIGMIATGSVIVLTLGLITIASQTFRASRSNPVDILKID
jgi:putative ABC transport system permease protein